MKSPHHHVHDNVYCAKNYAYTLLEYAHRLSRLVSEYWHRLFTSLAYPSVVSVPPLRARCSEVFSSLIRTLDSCLAVLCSSLRSASFLCCFCSQVSLSSSPRPPR